MDKFYKALGIFALLLTIVISFSGSNSRLYEGSIISLNIADLDQSKQVELAREAAVRLVMEKANYQIGKNLKAEAIDYGLTSIDFWKTRSTEQITNFELAKLIETAFVTKVDLNFFGLFTDGNLKLGEAELLLDYFVQTSLFVNKRTLARDLTQYSLIDPIACEGDIADDLLNTDPDCEFINGAIKAGVIDKIGTKVSPNKRYNRAEIAKLIVELLELPLETDNNTALMLEDKWHKPYFEVLINAELIRFDESKQLLPYADATSWYVKNILARIQ